MDYMDPMSSVPQKADKLNLSLQGYCKRGAILALLIWNYVSFYPSALRAGGVLSSRSGRPGGRLPNLRNPYLCNRLMDFLHSKFCRIV